MKCPLELKEEILELNYQPPNHINLIGSYAYNTDFSKEQNDVDIIIEIPKECTHPKDYLNERILRRRALYLQHVAAIISKLSWVHKVTYLYRDGFDKLPILCLYSKPESVLASTRFLINTTIDSRAFKLHRYNIKKNNIRRRWYFKGTSKPIEEPLSMHYNTWVLNQLTCASNFEYLNKKLKDECSLQAGIKLLKMWMDRKALNKGYASGLFITAYVLFLLANEKLRANMSPYEIFRITLSNLGLFVIFSDILLTKFADDQFKPTMEDFHSCFDVVFVDVTGHVNLCADMNICMYDMLRYEASETSKFLSSNCVEKFELIFLDKTSYSSKFDHILSIETKESIKTLSVKSKKLQSHLIDYCGNYTLASFQLIIKVLKKALDNRIKFIACLPFDDVEVSSWSIFQQFVLYVLKSILLKLGLLLEPLNANIPEERGPPANSPQVHEFQKFWGEKAEQYRYAGGDIVEVVRWPKDNMSSARTIVPRIVKFILNRHFAFAKEAIQMTGSQLDHVLKPVEGKASSDSSIYGTGEEQHDDVIKSFDALSKALRSLEDLPLTFNTIQGLSPIFRYTEVFPPVQSTSQSDAVALQHRLIPGNNKNCPQFFPKFQVLCMMERSGKWSDDREVIRRLKGAFYIKLAELLKTKFNYSYLVYMDKLQLYKSPARYVFELKIGFSKELSLSRRVALPGGLVRMEDTPEYLETYRNLVITPTFTSYLHGIQQHFNSFSTTVRLCKRWVSCHLLGDHVNSDVIELCVAYLYTSLRGPYMPPGSPMVGFMQFLQLISTHDWKLQPLIVNFNEEFTAPDYTEIESFFHKNRSSLPSLFISTPIDRHFSYITSPSPLMLQRLIIVARASLKTLESLYLDLSVNKKEFKQVFRPPISDYNVLIHLDLLKCSRPQLGLDFKYTSEQPPPKPSSRSDECFPLVEFDPVLLYLRDLKESFNDFAYFFYDVYGGAFIAVAWRPSAYKGKPYDESSMKFNKLVEETLNSEQALMIADEEAIVDEFQSLGFGLVKNIEILKPIKFCN
ncbi:hypothetical protein HELRODRAFT_106517 [Helobdella robusta]|uniref:Nucleolar protein 6 n=1 Tax=Helobdella robusta TaxID=6412 RepID=T1EE31_HELRO|nr:hypothetical protein HELRODRAFT_106517 [Helobdella robusta]ESO02201.1 hypothetical protein HELRODRAFT_106517 [Helobdella robusta]